MLGCMVNAFVRFDLIASWWNSLQVRLLQHQRLAVTNLEDQVITVKNSQTVNA